jgi:drug/metabolite transporter (DMT)-like permease
MEPKEKLVGVVAAVALAVIAVLFITVSPAHGQPEPTTTGPVIALVLTGLLVASLALANRIVSGLLAILAAFLLQTPHVAHSILYLRKGALVIAVGYALWLTLQQRHTQIDNRLRRAADRHRGDPGA